MALKINNNGIKLEILLYNGIYILDGVSGNGKSMLYRMIKDYGEHNEEMWTISFSEIESNGGYADIPKDKKLYLFDRYTAYHGKFTEEINELKKSSIVLIDSKFPTMTNFTGSSRCRIEILGDKHIRIIGAHIL